MKAKINWLWYWYVTRRLRNWPHWVACHLPKKIVYWCVVVAAVRTEPKNNPSYVTAEQMLKKLGVN